jgi:hypothetical protein
MKKVLIMFFAVVGMMACSEEKVDLKENQSLNLNSLAAPEPEDGDSWNEGLQDCEPIDEKVCCARPVLNPNIITPPNMIPNFRNAFASNNVGTFFDSNPYINIWPSLSDQTPIIDGLISGQNRMILVVNQTTQDEYYLIGSAAQTNQQIEENPLFVLILWSNY